MCNEVTFFFCSEQERKPRFPDPGAGGAFADQRVTTLRAKGRLIETPTPPPGEGRDSDPAHSTRAARWSYRWKTADRHKAREQPSGNVPEYRRQQCHLSPSSQITDAQKYSAEFRASGTCDRTAKGTTKWKCAWIPTPTSHLSPSSQIPDAKKTFRRSMSQNDNDQ